MLVCVFLRLLVQHPVVGTMLYTKPTARFLLSIAGTGDHY